MHETTLRNAINYIRIWRFCVNLDHIMRLNVRFKESVQKNYLLTL